MLLLALDVRCAAAAAGAGAAAAAPVTSSLISCTSTSPTSRTTTIPLSISNVSCRHVPRQPFLGGWGADGFPWGGSQVALPLRGTSDDGWFTATLTVTVTFTAIVTVIVVVTVINTVTVIVTVAITAALPLRGISGGGCFTVTFIVTVVVTFFVAVTAVPEHVRFPCECGREHVASSLCGGSGNVCTHTQKCLCMYVRVYSRTYPPPVRVWS